MKRLSTLVMIATIILIVGYVSAAEETTSVLAGNETEDELLIVEEIQTSSDSLMSTESATLFETIHRKILMIAEEVFDYLLTGDETQKQNYLDEYASLETDYASFEKSIDLDTDRNTDLKIAYDDLVLATDTLGTTAEAMLISYDLNKTITMDDVIAFEDAVDIALMKAQAVWDLNNPDNSGLTSERGATGRLKNRLLEAIEESYAYPVLGNETEKEDALARLDEFDAILTEAESQFPNTSFKELSNAKTDIAEAIGTMFASYEANNSVQAEDLAALEILVEEFNALISPQNV